MANTIRGLHHLTTITSSSPKIFDFMSGILGLHLIKKTVNQDDVHTYHLYFTDDMGSAGTDITFFDFPGIQKAQYGTDEISRTSFRIPNDAAFAYWKTRFDENGVEYDNDYIEEFGAKLLQFRDFDGQRYALISDENDDGRVEGEPWRNSTVEPEFAIRGLGPALLTIDNKYNLHTVLTQVMGLQEIARNGDYTLYQAEGDAGHGGQVITRFRNDVPRGVQGFGGPHHLAFSVDDQEALLFWINKLRKLGFQDSGFVDRFYFKSEYFHPTPGILFEIATNGPGFLQDETYDEAGIHLELPPFLENFRAQIESNLEPFNTGEDVKGSGF